MYRNPGRAPSFADALTSVNNSIYLNKWVVDIAKPLPTYKRPSTEAEEGFF